MGSSRLPGKVLMPLVGKPILWHILHRLRKCRRVDTVAIATSTSRKDDPIAEFGAKEGVPVIRGSEENVLSRYLLAAEELGADVVVRVTGDVPLVDPEFVDRMVETLLSQQAGYCMGDPEVPCIHEGVDPFTLHALRKLATEAGDDASAREHVTTYFKSHPDFVSVAFVAVEEALQFSGARISVDTPADIRFLEEIYSRLQAPVGEVHLREVVKLLRAEPHLLQINQHIKRKGAETGSHRVLIRCDGDSEIGLGHVVRCLALADELRDTHGLGIVFAMARGPVGFDLVQRAGYAIEERTGDNEGQWLRGLIGQTRSVAVILDVRNDLSRRDVEAFRKDSLVVVIDDLSDRRLAADLVFYPPVPQVRRLNWDGFTGESYVGWEWVPLRRQFANVSSVAKKDSHSVVLVTMGGSDPAGLTLQAVHALETLDEEFDAIVVVGGAFCHNEALQKAIRHSRRQFDIRRDVEQMAELMAKADFAVASFSVTAYELAAVGVPGIYLCLTDDHKESASAFADEGMGLVLGLFTEVGERVLSDQVSRLLRSPEKRVEMARRCRQVVDGCGAQRIARVIAQRLQKANVGP